MTAISPRARQSRIAAGLLLLTTAAGATAVAVGPAAAGLGSSTAVTHFAGAAGQGSTSSVAPDNTVWD